MSRNRAAGVPKSRGGFIPPRSEMLAAGNVELIGAPERVGNSEAQGLNSTLLPALNVKQFHFTSQSVAV